MSPDCNSFNANKQEQDIKYRSFLWFLTVDSQNGCDEHLLKPAPKRYLGGGRQIFQESPHLYPKHCDGAHCEAQAKPRTTGEKYSFAFTLAETLITLSIIAVVAMLTLPGLIQDYTEKEMVTRFKKVYNSVSSAYALTILQYGQPINWGWTQATNEGLGGVNSTGGNSVLDKLAINLKVVKRCRANSNDCGFIKNTKYLDGTNTVLHFDRPFIILADGSAIGVYSNGPCNQVVGTTKELMSECGVLTIDVNGEKGPNVVGLDSFHFFFTKYGLIPSGAVGDTYSPLTKCNKTGQGCTAWVLQKENMDYLKGPVKWD